MQAFDWMLLILNLISQQCIPTENKMGKSVRTVSGTYGWWSELKWSEDHVKIGVQYLWSNNIRN